MDETQRHYPLPHKDNIASEDVMRIRKAIEKIDEDMTQSEQAEQQSDETIRKHIFEQTIELWRDDERSL